MTASAFDILVTLGSSIVVAVVAAYVTVILSIRRFRAERWWDIRAEAYQRVVEALHNAKAFPDAHLAADFEGRKITPERRQEVEEQGIIAAREIMRAIDIGGYLLSENALARLKRYQTEREEAANTMMWDDYLQGTWAACNSCLEDMSEIAKKDLKIKN